MIAAWQDEQEDNNEQPQIAEIEAHAPVHEEQAAQAVHQDA